MKPHICELCTKQFVGKCPYPNPMSDDKCSMFHPKKSEKDVNLNKDCKDSVCNSCKRNKDFNVCRYIRGGKLLAYCNRFVRYR